jgi:clan AA aspartic protease (TIGR02281 family)
MPAATRLSFPVLLLSLTSAWALGWFSHAWLQHPADVIATINTPDKPAPNITVTNNTTPREAIQQSSNNTPASAKYRHEFAAQLAQHDITGLIDGLDTLRQQKDPRWPAFLAAFKETLATWLSNNQFEQVIDYTLAYIDRFYFDADIFQLQAAAYLKNRQPLTAIKSLFTQHQRTTSSSDAVKLHEQIDHVVDDYQHDLEQKKQWDELLTLYTFLVTTEPNNASYYFHLARVQVEKQDYANARLALAHVYDDPVLGADAQKLRQQMNNIEQGEIRIPLTLSGNNFTLDAVINETHSLNLLVDTGASVSAIPSDYFEKIRNDTQPVYLGTLAVHTANGNVNALRYRFRSLSLHGVEVQDVEILVMDNLPPQQGLLGMNVLGQFPFRIDQEKSLLLLNSH